MNFDCMYYGILAAPATSKLILAHIHTKTNSSNIFLRCIDYAINIYERRKFIGTEPKTYQNTFDNFFFFSETNKLNTQNVYKTKRKRKRIMKKRVEIHVRTRTQFLRFYHRFIYVQVYHNYLCS